VDCGKCEIKVLQKNVLNVRLLLFYFNSIPKKNVVSSEDGKKTKHAIISTLTFNFYHFCFKSYLHLFNQNAMPWGKDFFPPL
jgi:hypothetical protein